MFASYFLPARLYWFRGLARKIGSVTTIRQNKGPTELKVKRFLRTCLLLFTKFGLTGQKRDLCLAADYKKCYQREMARTHHNTE